MMTQTKFEVDEIVYIPFVVNRIEIDGVNFNGVKRKVIYQLKGKNVMDGSCVEVEETDFNKPGFEVKTARDFK